MAKKQREIDELHNAYSVSQEKKKDFTQKELVRIAEYYNLPTQENDSKDQLIVLIDSNEQPSVDPVERLRNLCEDFKSDLEQIRKDHPNHFLRINKISQTTNRWHLSLK